jgi:hypothetical protein
VLSVILMPLCLGAGFLSKVSGSLHFKVLSITSSFLNLNRTELNVYSWTTTRSAVFSRCFLRCDKVQKHLSNSNSEPAAIFRCNSIKRTTHRSSWFATKPLQNDCFSQTKTGKALWYRQSQRVQCLSTQSLRGPVESRHLLAAQSTSTVWSGFGLEAILREFEFREGGSPGL